jgi:L-lactate dehydrogenase
VLKKNPTVPAAAATPVPKPSSNGPARVTMGAGGLGNGGSSRVTISGQTRGGRNG